MLKSTLRLCPPASMVVMSAMPAFAHTGLGGTAGFTLGVAHPLGGVDHILVMVAVGLFAVQLGGRALWLVPLTFVFLMAASGALGMAGVSIPFVEAGIGLSVVVLGAAIGLGSSPPLALAMALVGAFAIFHGYAHGAEMPDTASGLAYAAGFVCATAALHLSGVGLGLAARRTGTVASRHAARFGGGLMAAAGIGLLARWI